MRVVDEHLDPVLIRLRLCERVVEDDVDIIGHWFVRVDLGHDDAVSVVVEHVGETHEDDVIVVDQGDSHRT